MLYYPVGYYSGTVLQTSPGQSPRQIFDISYNPMSNPDLIREASKVGGELYLQLGMTVLPRLRIEMQYCIPSGIAWEVGKPPASITQVYKGYDASLSALFSIRK